MRGLVVSLLFCEICGFAGLGEVWELSLSLLNAGFFKIAGPRSIYSVQAGPFFGEFEALTGPLSALSAAFYIYNCRDM